MECRCANVDVLWGTEAEGYAAEHLRSDDGELVCPDTGARWRVDPTEADPNALRRVTAPGTLAGR